MIKCDINILLKRPISEVFEFVTQCESFPIWNATFLEVRLLSKDSPGLRTLYLLKREIPQGDVENTLEVIGYEKNKVLKIETITGPASFVYRYEFSSKGDSTRLALYAEVDEADLPPRSKSSPTPKSIKNRLKENLRVLKTLLETGV